MGRCFVFIISKKWLSSLFILLSCLILLAFFSRYSLGIHTLSVARQEIIYDVMLDAGHGGIDPGAIGEGDLYEKHYVLDIVLQMRDILTKHGLKVGLTRDSDVDVSHLVDNGGRHRRDLLGRFKLMNQGAVGISVHANATKDKTQRGAIVFYQKDRYINEMYAKLVLEEVAKVQVLNEQHPVPRTTLLLLKSNPPVLLVEIGFMSNPDDLAKITDPQFRTSLAHALSQGILNFIAWRDGEQSE
jgi:N-acetylmuramoyl-L-alanine amidase